MNKNPAFFVFYKKNSKQNMHTSISILQKKKDENWRERRRELRRCAMKFVAENSILDLEIRANLLKKQFTIFSPCSGDLRVFHHTRGVFIDRMSSVWQHTERASSSTHKKTHIFKHNGFPFHIKEEQEELRHRSPQRA